MLVLNEPLLKNITEMPFFVNKIVLAVGCQLSVAGN